MDHHGNQLPLLHEQIADGSVRRVRNRAEHSILVRLFASLARTAAFRNILFYLSAQLLLHSRVLTEEAQGLRESIRCGICRREDEGPMCTDLASRIQNLNHYNLPHLCNDLLVLQLVSSGGVHVLLN